MYKENMKIPTDNSENKNCIFSFLPHALFVSLRDYDFICILFKKIIILVAVCLDRGLKNN